MYIESFGFGNIVLIVIVGLSIFLWLWGAINHENHLIEQSDNLKKVCLQAYKTDLKNNNEVKELCKNVKVRIEELEKGNNSK